MKCPMPQISTALPGVFLKMNSDQFKKIAVKVKGGDRYGVYDYVMPCFTVSLTELNPRRETAGHGHQSEEVYIFIEG